jgi:hypothetical protein
MKLIRHLRFPLVTSIALTFAALILPVRAQSSAEVEQLKATVAAMEKTIAEMKAKIEKWEAKETAQTVSTNPPPAATTAAKPAAPGAPAVASATDPATKVKLEPTAAGLADHGSARVHHDTISEDNAGAARPGNAPIDPTYAGFMPLFGTKTWIKLGGYAKLDAIRDSTQVGNPNKFVTASIPVPGQAGFDSGSQYTLQAKQTRLSLELRSPTPIGSLKVYYENDFFGSPTSPDMTYNLRHFYGQVANVLAGQTWSTFYDPDALPDTLDIEGPGMQSILRQPQLRYTFSPIKEHMHVALAIEQPKPDLVALPAGAIARNVMPDFAVNWRWEGKPGHIQLGGLVRALSYENPTTGIDDTALGWGFNISGSLNTWGRDNVVARFTVGDGVGRYMQDFSTSNGGVVDAAGDVQTLAAWGALIGYRHFWAERWHSQATYGYLQLDNRAEQGAFAYDHTHYVQGNLIWSATPSFYIGLEYLYGVNAVRNGADGDDHRIQMSLQYKLIR